MSQDDASRHPRETKGCDSTRCTCQAFGLHRPHSRRSRLIGAAADGYLGELVASLATASTMIKRGTLVVPETLAIGGVSTPWAFTDVWVIPVMYVMYYTAKYEASTMKTFEQPMKMIVIPMAITYVVSQFLNVCFTHKLLKQATLKGFTQVSLKFCGFTYLAWLNLTLFYLKSRLLYKVFGKTRGGRRLMPAVNKLLTIGILLVLATAGLQVFGMSKESLGLAGLASVTFALASQNLLTQFISSLVLCNPESPLSIGDTIRLLGTSGKVAEIGWFATTIVAPSTTPTTFPNSVVLQAQVENLSNNQARRMVEEFAVIPPANNPLAAFDAVEDIRQILREKEAIDDKWPFRVHVHGFKGKGLLVRLECFFDAPGMVTNPNPRDIELNGRHAVIKLVLGILTKHNCELGAYPALFPVDGAPPA